MAVYLVTWNLNKEGSNYSRARAALVNDLKKLDCIGDQGLETVAFVSTDSTIEDLHRYLVKNLDSNDRLVVAKLYAKQMTGLLANSTWDWINSRL